MELAKLNNIMFWVLIALMVVIFIIEVYFYIKGKKPINYYGFFMAGTLFLLSFGAYTFRNGDKNGLYTFLFALLLLVVLVKFKNRLTTTRNNNTDIDKDKLDRTELWVWLIFTSVAFILGLIAFLLLSRLH